MYVVFFPMQMCCSELQMRETSMTEEEVFIIGASSKAAEN